MNKDDRISPYYPIFVNIRGEKCLVVGGGIVALRKVQALLRHGANVTVVSPVLCPELSQLTKDGAIQVVKRSYKAEDLKNALLVIAATDDSEANERVAANAKCGGTLVNVVDIPQCSNFIVPSYFSRGDVTIAVSTSGKSPALARKIRSQLEEDFGIEYAQLALLANEVRSELKRRGITVDAEAWQEILNLDPLIKLLRDGKTQEVKNTMLNDLKALGQKKS